LSRNFVHFDAVWGEGPRGCFVLEPAEEVLRPDIVELDVVLEGVDNALALDGVGTLQVDVVGKEELLGAVELAAAALGLLGAVIPARPHPHAAAPVGLNFLHPSHVRMGLRVRRPHQHAVAHCPARTLYRHQIPRRRNTVNHTHTGVREWGASTSDDLVGSADGVGIDVLLALLGLRHGRGGEGLEGRNPRRKPRRGKRGARGGHRNLLLCSLFFPKARVDFPLLTFTKFSSLSPTKFKRGAQPINLFGSQYNFNFINMEFW
jgi:hypothetical protein